jgi:hypothetical protein
MMTNAATRIAAVYNGLGEELTIGGPAIIKVLYNTIDDKQ